MKQLIENTNVKEKRVLLRCDFNVPIKNGNVLDETKIRKSLDTINYLLKENAKIIILSHLGRVKTEEDKANNTLEPVKNSLERILGKTILFEKDILSEKTKEVALALNPGEILLLENIRFLDVPNMFESKLNDEVAKKLADLGEIFVFDAFATAHRKHTSVVGISKYLPSCLGFLVQKEMEMLDKTLKEPERPFTVIMGGAKVDDKLSLIETLLPKCDYLLVSGGIANSFLMALGLEVGESLKTKNVEILNELKKLMLKYREKFAFPLDVVIEQTFNESVKMKNINMLGANDIIKDIGTKTIKKYSSIIKESKTVFMNGTMGIYEEKAYKNGTIEIFSALKTSDAITVIGGGDTISALNVLGFAEAFTNVSSGGGATLAYISQDVLPGIDGVSEVDNIEVLDL